MQPHPTIAFALDIADKLIKLAAVFLGGIWTYWNYRKSRTYAQKLELEVTASIFVRTYTYVEITMSLKNLGGTSHKLHLDGSTCSIYAIDENLIQHILRVLPVFTLRDLIEPGESINDLHVFRLDAEAARRVWIKLDLRVVSGSVEWHQTDLVRLSGTSETDPGVDR